MELKDQIALIGIALTFVIGCANFVYTYRASKRTSFVNTVTTSRLKWIDSLRDKTSEFIATSSALIEPNTALDVDGKAKLKLQRDTLLHQIVLHLNPVDQVDQRIRISVDHIKELTDDVISHDAISTSLLSLREATGSYLKKEWNRVKKESAGKGA